MTVMRELDGGGATEGTIKLVQVVVDDFLDHMPTDTRGAACHQNPFKVMVTVRATPTAALLALDATLTL
jgi:hypothetical protein